MSFAVKLVAMEEEGNIMHSFGNYNNINRIKYITIRYDSVCFVAKKETNEHIQYVGYNDTSPSKNKNALRK